MIIENYENEIIEKIEKIDGVKEVVRIYFFGHLTETGMISKDFFIIIIPSFNTKKEITINTTLTYADDLEEELEYIINNLTDDIAKKLEDIS